MVQAYHIITLWGWESAGEQSLYDKACIIYQLLWLALSSLWHIKGTARKTHSLHNVRLYIIMLEYLL